MAADYSRIHRLLKILTLIQGSSGWTPQRLALECGVNERTIYRDMQMLSGAEIPFFFDKEAGGYGIGRDFFLPPVQLTLEEALSLAALAEKVGGTEQVPFMAAASKVIDKIRSQLPPSMRDELEKIEDQVAIRLAASSPPDSGADVYMKVRHALTHHMALLCEYDGLSKASGTSGGFVLRPYSLLFSQRSWYVIGYHSKHEAVRCLRLSRFNAVKATDETYEIPEDFSVTKYLGNAWRMIRGAESYDVELHFDEEFADTIADTQWHATQSCTPGPDKSLIFRCKVDGLDEIVWWVLSMGPHCVVKRPRELATRVQMLAASVVQKYAAE